MKMTFKLSSKQKGSGGGPLKSIRRRLTITGASPNIDGCASTGDAAGSRNPNGFSPDFVCAVTECSGVSKQGRAPYNPNKKNQDALIMHPDPSTNTLILCVLDGHGEHGDNVAKEFEAHLAGLMVQHPSWKANVKIAAQSAIDEIEKKLLSNFRIDTEFSGTTLSMAIIRGNRITGVNIGDSRVIIGKDAGDGSGKLVAEEFTHDHKPDTPKEKERILKAGGRVFAVEYDDGIDGPPRVWLGHMDVPGLAMSRSLGDGVAHTAGVSSEPEFTERDLDPAVDKCVVVASDGLWEFVSNQETIDMVQDASTPFGSVEKLVKEANDRWEAEEQVVDDTTVITASLFGYKSSA
jgi:serine/threonine protein phosphatase PrpC